MISVLISFVVCLHINYCMTGRRRGGGGGGGLHPENVRVSFVLSHKMSVLRPLWPFVCVDLLLLLFVCFLGVFFSYNHWSCLIYWGRKGPIHWHQMLRGTCAIQWWVEAKPWTVFSCKAAAVKMLDERNRLKILCLGSSESVMTAFQSRSWIGSVS